MNKWNRQKLARRFAISAAFNEEVERVFDSCNRGRFIRVSGINEDGFQIEYEEYHCGSWDTEYTTIPFDKFNNKGVSP